MPADMLKVLQRMTETQLTRQVIVPLIRAMFPDGRIEETHGSTEEGRDLVCIDKHPVLDRSHVLCVQVKNHKISYGATAGVYSIVALSNQVQQAKTTGVTRENGDRVQPDEVWLVSTHPFPPGNRKLSEDFLREISRQSGKFIAGDELVALLRKRCPSLVQDLESITDSRLATAIAWLSQHRESKAFGLRLDRTIDDFHVKSRVFPTGGSSLALLSGQLTFKDWTTTVASDIPYASLRTFKREGVGINQRDTRASRSLHEIKPVAERHKVPVTWTVEIEDALLKQALEQPTTAGTESGEDRGLAVPVERTYTVAFQAWSATHKETLRVALGNVPPKLARGTGATVKAILAAVRSTESALAELIPLCAELDCLNHAPGAAHEVGNLQITDEALLPGVAPRLLVQGAPGAGKTTFSRRLAVALLREKKPVVFVPCSAVTPEMRHASLEQIAAMCAPPGTPKSWKLENALFIVDGLDEAPFDLSATILEAGKNARSRIIATARAAFRTQLREEYPTLEIAGFSSEDRDAFFQRWFKNDPAGLSTVEALVASHPDIALHTRLPLIATLVAALVENKFAPTTRAEIYSQRLELLLERWEFVKGLRRLTVPRSSQLRFLKTLAFIVHERSSGRSSRFGWTEVRDAFGRALGVYGDKLNPDEFVRKLVMAAGVLEYDGSRSFTFGHLSFQEQLAGWYLADNVAEWRIAELLGNDWWAEPLKFYAGIKQDITELIEECEDKAITPIHKGQLTELVSNAPHTASVAVQVLESTRVDRV